MEYFWRSQGGGALAPSRPTLALPLRVGDMTGQGSREDYLAFLCLI